MKRTNIKRIGLLVGALISGAGLVAIPVSALDSVKTTAATSSSSPSPADQARLKLIITRGNSEITRRISALNALSAKISASTKLNSSDKSTLSDELNTEISGLTSLKTQLDAETTVSAAKADAQSIINDYRVFALIAPKVELVKTADGQQVTEDKLTALAAKLQTRITAAQSAGHSVTSMQSSLTDLSNKVSAAQTISSTMEASVIGLQPSDYNSNHSVLSGDRDQLKTAQTDIQAAIADAKSIVTSLKNL